MNEFSRKKALAFALLRRTGVNERNYSPPTFSFMWRIGVKIPPPHFIGFFPLVLIMGLPFGVSGLGIYMMDHGDKPLFYGVAMTLVFFLTIFFGGGIAFYYRSSARIHRLPHWKNL